MAAVGGLLLVPVGLAAEPSRPPTPPVPDGVTFNAAAGSYSVHRVPTRSVEAIMQSVSGWKHQVLADDSTADFSVEDGILSMECSACGLGRPTAIDTSTIDLDSVVAYEAGAWHIGIRSKDGTQDFYGVLRGELGPEPHDPDRAEADRRAALAALVDLYDLAYLAQNPAPATPPAAPPPAEPAAPAASARPAHPAPPATPPPVRHAPEARPAAVELAALAAAGDVDSIEAQRGRKSSANDVAHALQTAYAVRARTQMLNGQLDASLETLKTARQKFGKSAPLRDREAHYVVIAETYDRIRAAVKLNVPELKRYLDEVRSLETDDASSIEKMLARTLANVIADQRAAGRVTIADSLLKSARDLFPAQAELLGQGTAGALPAAGLEVSTSDGPSGERPK